MAVVRVVGEGGDVRAGVVRLILKMLTITTFCVSVLHLIRVQKWEEETKSRIQDVKCILFSRDAHLIAASEAILMILDLV